jgi:hypothetical protein
LAPDDPESLTMESRKGSLVYISISVAKSEHQKEYEQSRTISINKGT